MTLAELLVVMVILGIVASMSTATLRWKATTNAASDRTERRTAAIRSGSVITSCDSTGRCTVFLPDGRVVSIQPVATGGPS